MTQGLTVTLEQALVATRVDCSIQPALFTPEGVRALSAAAQEAKAGALIALGGGALSNPFVPEEVKKRIGCKIWLDTDDKTAFERILSNGLPPFLAGEKAPLEAFIRMNLARKNVFEHYADIRVVPETSPNATALHILSLYKDLYNL